MVENWGISSAGWFTSEMPAYDGGNCEETDEYLLAVTSVTDARVSHGSKNENEFIQECILTEFLWKQKLQAHILALKSTWLQKEMKQKEVLNGLKLSKKNPFISKSLAHEEKQSSSFIHSS